MNRQRQYLLPMDFLRRAQLGFQRREWLRSHLGLLLFVPVLALTVGGDWTLSRPLEPSSALLSSVNSAAESSTVSVALAKAVEGASLERGVSILQGGYLEIELETRVRSFTPALQANFTGRYVLSISSDGVTYQPVWRVGGDTQERGLTLREGTQVVPSSPVRFLRIAPESTTLDACVSWVRLLRAPLRFSIRFLAPLLWGAALLLLGLERWGLQRWPRALAWAEGLKATLKRHDSALAAVLSLTILFEVTLPAVIWGCLLLGLGAALALLKRYPLSVLAAGLLLYFTVSVVLPNAITKIVMAQLAKFHRLDVDHRLIPGSMPDINSDGLRFRGTAADLREDDFNILFLGDSFTFGFRLEYEQAYPYRLEALLRERCRTRVRAVNFGWTGSSPLLSLRLLKEIGYRYRPDLVVYTLDMTDFNDDLRYEAQLSSGGDLKVNTDEVFRTFLLRAFPFVEPALSGERYRNVLPRLRGGELLTEAVAPSSVAPSSVAPSSAASHHGAEPLSSVRGDKFFVTNYPLEQTREAIEQGTMKYLSALQQFCQDILKVPMVVVLFPRGYQYSARESPRNLEVGFYTVQGPYVKEPFRYFAEVSRTLPYPVIDLYDDFATSSVYPLYQVDDPHWTPAGATLVAESLERELLAQGLLPCLEP